MPGNGRSIAPDEEPYRDQLHHVTSQYIFSTVTLVPVKRSLRTRCRNKAVEVGEGGVVNNRVGNHLGGYVLDVLDVMRRVMRCVRVCLCEREGGRNSSKKNGRRSIGEQQ